MGSQRRADGPLSIVLRDPGDRIDGIRDYAYQLANGLADHGAPAGVKLLSSSAVPDPSPGTEAVLINYNPFSWGRWGWAPALPASLQRLRRRRDRPTIAVIVHEPFVDFRGGRESLMATWHRAQLAATLRVADLVLVSTEAWRPLVRRWAGARRPIHHLPVGSNLPDMRASRDEERARLGLDREAVLLAMFGGQHPSRPVEHLKQAILATSREGRPTVVVNLGADPPQLPASIGGARIVTPGRRTPVELARLLSGADIFVGPFVDGASSRRTTLAAALQHALPTVSTRGESTDRFLEQSAALILTPATDAKAFGAAVGDLARDPQRRPVLGQCARRLFEERLDWGAIARRLLDLLAGARSR